MLWCMSISLLIQLTILPAISTSKVLRPTIHSMNKICFLASTYNRKRTRVICCSCTWLILLNIISAGCFHVQRICLSFLWPNIPVHSPFSLSTHLAVVKNSVEHIHKQMSLSGTAFISFGYKPSSGVA